jgi:hypothetical protein
MPALYKVYLHFSVVPTSKSTIAMMRLNLLVTFLSAVSCYKYVVALPLGAETVAVEVTNGSYVVPKLQVKMCDADPNCINMYDEWGWYPKMVNNNFTELNHKLNKRDGCNVYFTASTYRQEYGTVNPYDVVHHLYDVCHEHTCDEDSGPYTINTYKFAYDQGINNPSVPITLKLTGKGEMESWDMRNAFASALAQFASKGQYWKRQVQEIRTPDGTDEREIWVGEGYAYYQVNRWCNGYVAGNMRATVWNSRETHNSCSDVFNDMGNVVNVLSPLPDWFNGVWGLLGSLVCSG